MTEPDGKRKLEIADGGFSTDVPTFACIVYVAPSESGGVLARVANLDGIDAVGASERDALAKVVPAFKAAVSKMVADGTPIPWIDPPSERRQDEQQRYIPVHL